MEIRIKTHRDMIDHVFLPRKISAKSDNLHRTESTLLKAMTQTILSFESEFFPSVVRELFTNMKRLHCDDDLDPEAIAEQLKNMKPGEMLGIYVRAQNCGLFICMREDNKVTLATFRASLQNETIYGDHISGDIQVDYPTRAITVESSTIFKSEEFAEQINLLNSEQMDRAMPKLEKSGHAFTEKRDATHPMYVSEWLLAVLSNRSSAVNKEFPVISKKMRDEIIVSAESTPFRRSGFYTAIKVFLQLGLTVALGPERGKFLYKLVMLQFMCPAYHDRIIDDDTAVQIIAKIARRMDKIESYSTSSNELGCDFIGLKKEAMSLAGKVVRDARIKLNKKLKAIYENNRETSNLEAMPRLQFERDILYEIPKTLAYIRSRNQENEPKTVDHSPRPGRVIRHQWQNDDLPDVSQLNRVYGEFETLMLLADIEHWIFVSLKTKHPNLGAEYLRELADAYMAKAQVIYKDDCFGYSKMVLAMLKIIQIMDTIAIEEHTLLKEHSSGINPKIIENLLLPSQFFSKIAMELQIYFEDRNNKAHGPGLLEESKISTSSFSVRYAAGDSNMQKLRLEILEMAKVQIAEKEVEWQKAREKVRIWRRKFSEMTCETMTAYSGKTVHSNTCSRHKFNRMARDHTVSLYERPLKPELYNQNAVVFELLLPPKIGCLRDVLHLFVTNHYAASLNKKLMYGKWTEYRPISGKRGTGSGSKNVFLGSSTVLFKNASYNCGKHPDAVSSVDELVVDNGYDCSFFGGTYDNISFYTRECTTLPIDKNQQSIKKYVTFSVQSPSVYSGLQWTLEGTSHTQNSVITKQCECPEKLSPKEFVNFGSLRADGHRMQLRNLYRELETEGLSFETQSVLALVMQTLWEAGPLDAARSQWYRESHQDFADGVFAMAMIDLLEKFVIQQESNWKHPLKLSVATIIAVKIFEINSDAANADRIVKLLLLIREKAIAWIALIVEAIGRCNDEKSRAIANARSVQVAICGVFTYFVSRHHQFFDKIFADGSEHSSLFAWLHFIVTIKNNSLIDDRKYEGITRLLIRMVYNIGLNAEAKLQSLIGENRGEVYKFVRFQWSESEKQTIERIQRNQHSPQIIFMHVHSGTSRNFVQIDILSGDFSVNNFAATRLPEDIASNEQFTRVFGATVFQVQPSGPSNSQFTTVHQYNGCHYIFRTKNEHRSRNEFNSYWQNELKFPTRKLTIIERRPDGNNRELVPLEHFTDEIPYLLVEGYSHWWDKRRQIIEFRPKTFESKDFSTPDGVHYELDLNKRQLKQLKTGKLLLDVSSDSYKRIVKFLSRLEHQNYIHVIMDEPAKAKVHLMRMKLKFVIDCTKESADKTYDVVSNEHCGMRVRLDQMYGTLIGLKNGLMLESIPTANQSNSKLLIVPHGKVSISESNRHVAVHIDLINTKLRTPSFFIYHLDIECRYMKANNYPGWLYLAYLHAITTYPLPDPFTRMTGTERALQILQSARVWSSSPYDEESIATLRLIAALTPIRSTQPRHLRLMQHIQWPKGISSIAAQDSYLPIVQKLVSDSERLAPLHFQTEKTEIKSNTYLPLNERAHARFLPYFPNCSISDAIISPRNAVHHFEATEDDTNLSAVRQLSVAYHESTFISPSNPGDTIHNLLTNGKHSLVGVSSESVTVESLIELCLHNKFPDLWIRLYDWAHRKRMTPANFHLILTLLAFEGIDINQLCVLQSIAANADEFKDIHPPDVESYEDLKKRQFDEEEVKKTIDQSGIGLSSYLSKQIRTQSLDYHEVYYGSRKQEFENEYKKELSTVTQRLTDHAKKNWQCDEFGDVSDISSEVLDINAAVGSIKLLLRKWNNNHKLLLFTEKVEAKLKELNGASKFSPDGWPVVSVATKSWPKYAIDFEEKLSRNFEFPSPEFEGEIERARQIFLERSEDNERTLNDWWQRFLDMSIPSNEIHLVAAGLYPRLIPSLVLPKLLQPMCERRKFMIGAIAVMTTREQRAQRIRRFEHQPQMQLILSREHSNRPHINWTPHERPEWLLMEIEMDLSIREVQVQIAERMIDPPGDQHSVMQLNMGEGKTAVIVPILAAVLADGKQLCTVTVLKSLFQTNLRSLRQCLGGILNRRIYTFPCRRDMQIETVVGDLLAIYEECKREGGVVVALPEFRLSFQLKIYEATRKGDPTSASHFLTVHKWLNANARHILDESDALLDAKYQLIYTIGAQLPLDGGALRWKVIQAVLKRVPFHMRKLFNKYGDQAIEFKANHKIDGIATNGLDIFPPCRLLNESVYIELMDGLIEDFLNRKLDIVLLGTMHGIRELIRNVLRDPKIKEEDHAKLMHKFEVSKSDQEIVLILSGLLKFEVLQLSLTKRWRVNYGVSSNGRRKMAVPFRAKDVSAEMTEFGHPDVAICLTYLSYYYSGLSDAQLLETFDVLSRTENPREIYSQWIRNSIPPKVEYSAVNLSDPTQRKSLFRSLRYNMHVIDYWLSTMVFPREAKIFEGKLMCSAWDLCTENLKHIATGFSGTNDTKELLPLPIVQNDLPEMEETNEKVREKLLREENNQYRQLRPNVTGMEILKLLVDDKIPVLLDSGALMLELNNKQVAREWLNMVPIGSYDAAIFFSKDDLLMTVDRNGVIDEFENSVYRNQLSRCLVYLDDVHTRGTDLKFPKDTRACVTLCGRITRDKTVQSCMRMRMLGEGHTISFWASHEADIGIREINKLAKEVSVTSLHVIEYICDNSRKFEKDGLVHWTAAALNYTQKLAAHKCFDESMALSELSERCTDPENTPLIEMYGAKKAQLITAITRNQLNRIASIYEEQHPIFDWINKTRDNVVSKLEEEIPDVERLTMLDQEHERELEHELEEQRQIFRPLSVPPFTPHFDSLLRDVFTHGRLHPSFAELVAKKSLRTLPLALERTKLFSIVKSQVAAWDDNILVTADFSSVAALPEHEGVDEFLRPVWWIGQIIEPNDNDVFVLLSTFECNSLLPTFRATTRSVLHMFSPKLLMSHSHLLNDAYLRLPANSTADNVALAKAVQIAMFAGSMYFNDQHEETAYANFMGLMSPQQNEEQPFEDGASNGYVPDKLRHLFPELAEACRFTENPDRIAKGIIERRHGHFSSKSHIALLLNEGKRVRWDE